jgi:hypothetical protein
MMPEKKGTASGLCLSDPPEFGDALSKTVPESRTSTPNGEKLQAMLAMWPPSGSPTRRGTWERGLVMMKGHLRSLEVLKFKDDWIFVPTDRKGRDFYENFRGLSVFLLSK